MKNLLVAAILALSLSLCNLGDRLKDLGKREQNSNQSGNSQPGNQNSNQSNTDVAEGDDVPPPPQPGNSNGGSGAPISGGVLNAKAVSLPKPAYPKVAKAAGASGTVTVQVLVDETGKVTSARAVTGHPLLRQAAVEAAYQARFTPTKLDGKPVKVTGVINYNFVPE